MKLSIKPDPDRNGDRALKPAAVDFLFNIIMINKLT
jgi:hypothetical protein